VLAREQQWQRLGVEITEMWQQLGFKPEALLSFAQAMLADDRTINVRGGCVGAGPKAPSPLPEGSPLMLHARYRTLSELATSMNIIMMPQGKAAGMRCQKGWIALDAHSRQHQQLLQAVCWPLPELLLRTALLCGEGEPLVTYSVTALAS
jgi:hypothetical protein